MSKTKLNVLTDEELLDYWNQDAIRKMGAYGSITGSFRSEPTTQNIAEKGWCYF